MSAIMPGAEPESFPGGPVGVLVLHGYTGTPQSMRGLAQALAAAGNTVELPLLPGHGTTVDDLMATGFDDWAAGAEAVYEDLASRCDRVVVAGLSMGGTVATWLAARHPELAGLIAINAAVLPQPEMEELLLPLLEAGETSFDAIGGDIALEGAVELGNERTPLAPLVTLGAAIDELQGHLADIACPVLVLSSPEDHVVPPAASDHLAASVSGPVTRVSLDRSYHVATLDHDAGLIESESVAFVARVGAV